MEFVIIRRVINHMTFFFSLVEIIAFRLDIKYCKGFFLEINFSINQSHYREVAWWEIFMEQELRFGLDLGRFGNF